MKHNEDGTTAENKVADYLARSGFDILDRNWKTKQCEVDIIARKNGCIYFVEVKYRNTPNQGVGFEYITRSKLKQMQFAANYWVSSTNWKGEFVLSAASVSGESFDIEFIEEI